MGKNRCVTFFALAVSALALSACNAPQGSSVLLSQDDIPHTPSALPSSTSGGAPSAAPATSTATSSTPAAAAIGPSCHSGDSSQLCLGLKYVAYENSQGTPVVTSTDAISNLATINSTWAQCQIAFQIDEFLETDPTTYGLNFNPSNSAELDPIRKAFDESTELLVVTTGTWNRSGTLGNTGANAWTNMPGATYLGSILESPVGTYPLIIAHELGHYLNLPHVNSTTDLMNPLIYSTSNQLTTDQCSAARQAVSAWWTHMLR